jgi:hypothetical protein
MLRAHKARTYGLTITSPNRDRSIKHHSVAFADDTEGQVSCDTNEHTSIPRIVKQLQHSGQTWSNLTSIFGGLITLHKCHWHLLQWEEVDGNLVLRRDTPEKVILHDGKGASSTIKYLPPNEPNVGLGFHLCPDGNQAHHFNFIRSAIRKLCKSSMTAYLTEDETRQLLNQRMLPKLQYALHGTSFSKTQCDSITSLIRGSLLPRIRLNRHFPGAVLHAPMEYGGLEFPNVHIVQDQVQLKYLIKQLRWDKVVANDFLVTLDIIQLCSGLTSPILASPTIRLDYLDQSYIMHLRSRLAAMDCSLWIERAWTPVCQRVGDKSLMGKFITIPKIANSVRLFLRVVTISDLADIAGRIIPEGILTGDWQANSDLKWPYQPKPSKAAWRDFRSCL